MSLKSPAAKGDHSVNFLMLRPQFSELSSFLRGVKGGVSTGVLTDAKSHELSQLLEKVKAFFNSNISSAQVRYAEQKATIMKKQNELLSENLAESKIKNNEYTVQMTETASLRTELALANEKIFELEQSLENQLEEAKTDLVQNIGRRLKLGVPVSNENELVKAINKVRYDSNDLSQSLIDSFRLPRDTDPGNIVLALKQKITVTQQEESENFITSLREEILERTTDILHLKDQNSNLNEQLTKVNGTVRQLKAKLRAKCEEVARLTEPKPETKPTGDADFDRLLRLFDDMTVQYESQAVELAESVEKRSILAAAVERLMAVNKELEELKTPEPEMKSEVYHILRKIQITDIGQICDDMQSSDNYKLGKIVSSVNKVLENQKQVEERVKFMRAAIYGQLKFLNMLLSSKNLLGSVILERGSLDDAVGIVKTQIARTQSFIQSYAVGYSEDCCIFEEMLKKGDTSDVLEAIQKYVDRYGRDETEDLFILFIQAVAACDVLRKFAMDAQQNCARQASEIKNLKEYSSQLQQSCDMQTQSVIKEQEDVIHSVRSILRESVINGNMATSVLESLDNLNDVMTVDDREYIDALQKQNSEMKQQIESLEKDKATIVKQTRSDLVQIQKQFGKMKSDSDKRVSMMEVLTNKLTEKVNEKRSVIKGLTKNIQKLEESNAQLKAELEETTDKYNRFEEETKLLVTEIQEQFNAAKADCMKALECARLKADAVHDQDLMEFAEVRNVFKEKINRLKRRLVQEQEASMELQNQIKQLTEANAALKKSSSQASYVTSRLEEKLKEAHNNQKKLRGEISLLEMKLNTREEQGMRSAALLESQMKMRMIELENESQRKLDDEKASVAAGLQNFLVSICRIFNNYVNVELPINMENVNSLLQRVKSDLKTLPILRESKDLLDDVKSAFKIKHNDELLERIARLIMDVEKMGDQVSDMRHIKAESEKLESWVEKMFQICSGGFSSGTDKEEMQRRIEEALYSNVTATKTGTIESLRAQKKLLLNANFRHGKSRRALSLRSVMTAIMFTARMSRNAGHVETGLCVPPAGNETESALPIFSQFIFDD